MSLCKNTGWYGPIITMVMRGKDGKMLHSMHEIQKQGKKMHKYDKNIFLTQRFNKLHLRRHCSHGRNHPTHDLQGQTLFLRKSHLVGLHVCLQPQSCWFALLQVWCSGQGSGVLTRGNVNVPLTPFSCFMCNPCIVLSETKRDVSSREGTGQQM